MTNVKNYLKDNTNIDIDELNNAQAQYTSYNLKDIQKKLGIKIDDKDIQDNIGKKRKSSKKNY